MHFSEAQTYDVIQNNGVECFRQKVLYSILHSTWDGKYIIPLKHEGRHVFILMYTKPIRNRNNILAYAMFTMSKLKMII